jgi:hypothetical protein
MTKLQGLRHSGALGAGSVQQVHPADQTDQLHLPT